MAIGWTIILFAVLATAPLTLLGRHIARRHRRVAFAAASLLLVLGVNFTVDPPPPPRSEMEQDDEEGAQNGEPN
jgi:hypothetical protein